MKKLLGLLMVVFLLVGCSGGGKGESKDKLAEIKEKGTIVIGTNSGYPPYEFYDMKDNKKELVGYDIDLGNKLAADLGVKAEFVDMDFEALSPSLLSNKVDIVLAGMVATEDRKQTIDFSDPYFNSQTKLVTKKENLEKYKDLKNLKGKKIVVQAGTTQEKAAKAIEGAEVLSIPAVADTIAHLETGKADVLLIAEVSAKTIIAQYPVYEYTDVDLPAELLVDGAAIGITKNQEPLKAEFNKLIAKYQKAGDLDKMFTKNVELAEKIGK